LASVPEERLLLARTRWLAGGFGLLQMLIGIYAATWGDTVINNALTIAGFVFGLLLGLFALGVLTRRVGENAALFGGATGLLVLLIVQFVLPAWGIKVAFDWLALIGSVTTFVAACLCSMAFPKKVPGAED
jgi:peptidoglycan/LPS O-acetylase OafA/YrhL